MKNRKIMKTILSCLYCLPFVAVLGLSAYATFNENAKDSYSETYVENVVNISNLNNLNTGLDYTIAYKNSDVTDYNYLPYIEYSNISINWVDYGGYDGADYYKFRIRTNDNLIQLIDKTGGTRNLFNVWGNNLTSFTFTYVNKEYATTTIIDNVLFYETIFRVGTLDNAFEYGIDRFNDLGFEKMGFMQYFTDLFVTTPNRYTTFINSYFNYFLLVTCVSVLPRVLYWFVEWSVSFTERFTRKDN